jgi:threonine synthase
MGRVIDLECPECRRRLPADQIQTFCADCDSPLFARYDLSGLARHVTPGAVASRPAGL